MTNFVTPDKLWLAGFVVIAATGLGLAVTRSSKTHSYLDQLGLRNCRASSAGTPPREIPSEKSNKAPSNHADVLPPQGREALTRVKSDAKAVDEQQVKERALPMKMNYRTCSDTKYTPTGFSVQEIKSLGDFPDYAELSGVPLPAAYPEFDIDKALPRPYRPFRWAYHQTMCRYSRREEGRIADMNSPHEDGGGLVD